MTSRPDLADALVATWKTNQRVTAFLFENLPDELWPMPVTGMPRRSVRTVAGHIHNARCMWIKMLGRRHGIGVPRRVGLRTVTRKDLLPALQRSSRGIVELLELGLSRGGRIPASGVPWVNLPLDVVHFLAYLVAHEGHHRGQLVMLARQMGHRLPAEVTTGLWQWSKRAKEASGIVVLSYSVPGGADLAPRIRYVRTKGPRRTPPKTKRGARSPKRRAR